MNSTLESAGSGQDRREPLLGLSMHEGFIADLNRAPVKVKNAVMRSWDVLKDHPPAPDPPKMAPIDPHIHATYVSQGRWRTSTVPGSVRPYLTTRRCYVFARTGSRSGDFGVTARCVARTSAWVRARDAPSAASTLRQAGRHPVELRESDA